MINLKLSNTFPYKEILKKVRTNFDKMKKVSKIEKEYKKQICVINGNQTAAADCVNKRLVTLRLKSDGFELLCWN